MRQSTDCQALFLQLQSRYPTSGLLTELVQIQDGQYIVRALVQVSGTAIATSMAAAATLELAEDQARLRVLSLLGIGDTSNQATLTPPSPTTNPLPLSSNGFTSLPSQTPSTWLDSEIPVTNRPPITPPPEPPLSPVSLPVLEDDQGPNYLVDELEQNAVEDSLLTTAPITVEPPVVPPEMPVILEQTPVAPRTPKTSSKPKKVTKAEPAITTLQQSAELEAAPETEPELPAPEPDDLSFLIAQTDIEMDRIGWTKQQGREYLKETYNKSTRQRLDADELMDFLNYLRALPSLHGL